MFKILWLDDQIDQLSDSVQNVRDNLTEPVIIFEAKNFEGAISMVDDFNNLSLMILDYSISDSNTIDKFLKNIKEVNCPKVIFTNFPSEAEKNMKIDIYGGIYKIISKKDIHELIEFLNSMLFYKGFTLVHMSDLHFDSKARTNNKADQLNRITKFFEQVLNSSDYLAITGDIADKNNFYDYNEVLPILKKELINKFGKNYYDKTFIIPGNHDMHWDNYSSSILSENCYYNYTKFYIDLLGEKSKNDLIDFPQNTLPIIQNINTCWKRKLRDNISIIGLNSSTNNIELKGKGVFSEKDHNIIESEWNKHKSPNEIRILLTHHNVFVPPTYSKQQEKSQMIENGFLIKSILEHGCDLILSGHTHTPNIFAFEHSSFSDGQTIHKEFKKFINISCGTFGGIGSSLNYASKIHFLPNKTFNGWNIEIEPFQYNVNDSEWVTNNNNKKLAI